MRERDRGKRIEWNEKNNGTICDLTKIDHRYCCSIVVRRHRCVPWEQWRFMTGNCAFAYIGYVQTLNEIHITNKCLHTLEVSSVSILHAVCSNTFALERVWIHTRSRSCGSSNSTIYIWPLSKWLESIHINTARVGKNFFFPPKLISVGLDTFTIYLTFIRVFLSLSLLLCSVFETEIDEHIVCTASNYHCQPFLCRPDCRLLSLAMCFFLCFFLFIISNLCIATATHRITQWKLLFFLLLLCTQNEKWA